jgi:hypothetical protein
MFPRCGASVPFRALEKAWQLGSRTVVIDLKDRRRGVSLPSKYSIRRCRASIGPEHDLYNTVLFVSELLVHLRRVFEFGRMRYDKARINQSCFDLFKKGLRISLNVGPSRFIVNPLFIAAPTGILSPIPT